MQLRNSSSACRSGRWAAVAAWPTLRTHRLEVVFARPSRRKCTRRRAIVAWLGMVVVEPGGPRPQLDAVLLATGRRRVPSVLRRVNRVAPATAAEGRSRPWSSPAAICSSRSGGRPRASAHPRGRGSLDGCALYAHRPPRDAPRLRRHPGTCRRRRLAATFGEGRPPPFGKPSTASGSACSRTAGSGGRALPSVPACATPASSTSSRSTSPGGDARVARGSLSTLAVE